MACTRICPYFIREEKTRVYCEMCRFTYPSKEARRQHVYTYCGSIDGFEKCYIKRILDDEYERNLKKHKSKEKSNEQKKNQRENKKRT